MDFMFRRLLVPTLAAMLVSAPAFAQDDNGDTIVIEGDKPIEDAEQVVQKQGYVSDISFGDRSSLYMQGNLHLILSGRNTGDYEIRFYFPDGQRRGLECSELRYSFSINEEDLEDYGNWEKDDVEIPLDLPEECQEAGGGGRYKIEAKVIIDGRVVSSKPLYSTVYVSKMIDKTVLQGGLETSQKEEEPVRPKRNKGKNK